MPLKEVKYGHFDETSAHQVLFLMKDDLGKFVHCRILPQAIASLRSEGVAMDEVLNDAKTIDRIYKAASDKYDKGHDPENLLQVTIDDLKTD